MFTYSGAEGKEFTKTIKPLVSKLRHKGIQSLSGEEQQILQEKLDSEGFEFLKQVEGRFVLQKLGKWEDIQQRDFRDIRKLYEKYYKYPEDDIEERIYKDLFFQIAQKTGEELKYNRQLNRCDVFELLQIPLEASSQRKVSTLPVDVWIRYLKNVADKFENWHTSTELEELLQWEVLPVPIDSYLELKPQFNPSLLPENRVKQNNKQYPNLTFSQVMERETTYPVLIKGDAGTGKSTCLKFLCYQHAIKSIECLSNENNLDYFRVPILIYLRRFGNNSLKELIYGFFRSFKLLNKKLEFQDVLDNSHLLLLLDGLDEVKTEKVSDLVAEIASWSEAYPNHKLIVTTRKQPAFTTAENFDYYEIQLLNDNGVWAFTRSYLQDNAYSFRNQAEERGLEDLIRIPLLLILCLIIFNLGHASLDKIADIYKQILEQYKTKWEHPKKDRFSHPYNWDLLEKSLSHLAYRMISDNYGYVISRYDALKLLADLVNASLIKQHIWSSNKHNIEDLLSQLLVHNFLEISNDEISFWHGSFRDFFAAKFIETLESPVDKAIKLASKQEWSLVTVFLDGLLSDTQDIRNVLVNKVNNSGDEGDWPIETLRLMGTDAIIDILRGIRQYDFIDSISIAGSVLSRINFEGDGIIEDTINFLWNYYNDDEYLISDPEYSYHLSLEINFADLVKYYYEILDALVEGSLEKAKNKHKDMYAYIALLIENAKVLDQWLLYRNVIDLADFKNKFKQGSFTSLELMDFCKNTILVTSLPFLDFIFQETKDFSLRLEAHLGYQAVYRS